MYIREFFGFGGYSRPVEGYLSWQHLMFATAITLVMILLAVFLGRRNRAMSDDRKKRVLIWSALLIDGFEIFKIILMCFREQDSMYWVRLLPLFLCSIQLITIPLAAFTKGRLKGACLDFVMIFGLIGALMGTYFAGNNYAAYPVLCFDNVVSGITHCIAGFVSLYILFSGMTSMEKRNIPITMGILGAFCVAAYVVNSLTECNYMFLSQGDGTPYDIVYNFVGGNPVLYPLCVIGLFLVYIGGYYSVFFIIRKRKMEKVTCKIQ